jgi:uncharacterized membrane protein
VDLLQFLLVLAVLVVAVLVISGPLRRPRGEREPEDRGEAALEAAKEAKYREIRDAELDRRTGKLSEEDWRGLDAQLRAEAVEILRRLDQSRGT